jgi:hypothetical protein
VLRLARGLVARREEPSGFAGHGAARVGLDIGEVPEPHVVLALERLGVERVELHGAIVARVDVQGTG